MIAHMRIRAPLALLPLLTLGGCQLIREANIRECSEFFRNSRDPRMDASAFQRACTCAVEREAAGQTPIASVPERPNPALGSFRRHLPDCIAANGGRANGVAARESSGEEPRPRIFDPATGRVSDPPNQVMPGPGDGGDPPPAEEPPPGAADAGKPPSPVVGNAVNDAERALEDAQREIENAMRSINGR
jgi:hypothetical protein